VHHENPSVTLPRMHVASTIVMALRGAGAVLSWHCTSACGALSFAGTVRHLCPSACPTCNRAASCMLMWRSCRHSSCSSSSSSNRMSHPTCSLRCCRGRQQFFMRLPTLGASLSMRSLALAAATVTAAVPRLGASLTAFFAASPSLPHCQAADGRAWMRCRPQWVGATSLPSFLPPSLLCCPFCSPLTSVMHPCFDALVGAVTCHYTRFSLLPPSAPSPGLPTHQSVTTTCCSYFSATHCAALLRLAAAAAQVEQSG
jgi:hypothetical protein